MAVYCFRRPLLSVLFILAIMQGISSHPHRFLTASDDFEYGNREAPSGSQIWSTDGDSQNQERPFNNNKRPVDQHVDLKPEGKIVSSSTYLNSGYASSNSKFSTTQKSNLDWDLQDRRVLDRDKRPALNRGTTQDSDSRIVFPSDVDNHHNSKKVSTVPVCQGTTFCENAPYYPDDLLNNVINQADEFKYLSGVDVISNVVQRIDISDDSPLCVANEQVVYPQSAENKKKEWLFVVNHRNFTQGVKIESCSELEGECNYSYIFPEGYKTTCKQKYIYRQLAAISPSGKIKPDSFRFPSSCCCHVKFIGNPLLRMGVLLPKANVTPVPKKTEKK
ncbi:uncharacterized protein LOC117170138 isoform X2 [Belonocnema kinseyi]|uniref:uncharacterized protein LOC117170138 isoform X2 n=1 Tax=Belonocnema kinseyi TaxID=2817044 RepID=UPI00143D1632|nr:uncharacterized protein LOC117170138 isoform X2 [Belonocnema kinseyi]